MEARSESHHRSLFLPDRIDLMKLMTYGDHVPVVLKTNRVLTMVIFLGLSVDMRGLYAPSNEYVVYSTCHDIR